MNGVLNIYKPQEMSSFDVVRKIRNLSHTKKVGHTGTLDPLASGVLPVCIGRATKIADYIMNSDKVYSAELKLGIVTDTFDREGKILNECSIKSDSDSIKDAILSFAGETWQLPPMYSAIKINGKKLYELARKGITVEREKRKITISSIEILKIEIPYVLMNVHCSKGTYIRSLCYDIGEKLGCGGTMWNLERISTGGFNKDESVSLNDLNEENIESYLIPMESALKSYNKIIIDDMYEKKLLNGISIEDENILKQTENSKIYKVYLSSGKFIGLGGKYTNKFKIIKLLALGE